MTNLTIVKDSVKGWNDAVLTHDTDSDRYFVVSTASPPWAPERVETLAYVSDSEGTVDSVLKLNSRFGAGTKEAGAPRWVAGARGMDRDEALADLSARLEDGVLLTPEQVDEADAQRYDEDEQEFQAWLQDPFAALKQVLGV